MEGMAGSALPPPTRARVVGRGALGLIFPGLATLALARIVGPWAWCFPLAFLIHWLGWYPRAVCLHCTLYGRVCPSWGGKISALLYDRPDGAGDPASFRRRKRLGFAAGIALRAIPIVVIAVALAGARRGEPSLWGMLGALAALAFGEGALYLGRICRGCRMAAGCPVRWGNGAVVSNT